VNFEELDIALEELETRLERLRALYEQYFLGFEKIEPQVARKDVDRRIYVLRREKIRNTGKRFKLQTIIQRYNTFAQYWQRICREIENGTYRRHLARAERTLGADKMLTIAAKRRFGKASVEQLAANAVAAQPGALDDASPLDEIEAGDLAVGEPFPPELGTDRAPLPAIPASPARSPLPPRPRTVPPGTLPPVAPPRTARPSKYESLTLEMDFLDSWDPETSVRSRHQGSAPKEAPPPAAPPRAAPPRAPAPPRAEAAAPTPEDPARPKSSPKAGPPPKPAARMPPPKPGSLPRPSPPNAPPIPVAAPPVRAPAPVPAPRVPAPAPAPAPRAPAPAAAKPERPASPPAAAAKSSSLSEDRIKELHANLVRIKRENNEAGQVSVESLAKTLRATEEKLRAEHKNRRIEFEVVLRDGKAVVKPKVR
jgi:hypothetical protein